MKIDTSIQKMEEALEKKKKLRAEKDKERVTTLEGRIKLKTEKITKLQDDLANLTTEKETVEARIKEAGGATKEEDYVPGKESSQKNAGDQTGKSTTKIASKKK
jgi:chaperonin cofactor prefoldin